MADSSFMAESLAALKAVYAEVAFLCGGERCTVCGVYCGWAHPDPEPNSLSYYCRQHSRRHQLG